MTIEKGRCAMTTILFMWLAFLTFGTTDIDPSKWNPEPAIFQEDIIEVPRWFWEVPLD